MTRSGGTNGLRRVCVVTGSRAEYGLLKSVMEAVRRHPKLRLQLVATGMHLLRKFGYTVDEIEADGWAIDARVRMQGAREGALNQAEGLAAGVKGIARYCDAAKTDVVVVLGDRIEAMAGALAGLTTGKIVAHIHGGDVAQGDFDDPLRHSITKLSHIHFAATPGARKRIIAMGEEASRVHFVGAPGLDELIKLVRRRARGTQTNERRNGDSRGSRTALVVQHGYGRSPATEQRVMGSILSAVAMAGLSRTIVYPNADRGHSGVIAAIESHSRKSTNGSVVVARSLPRSDFLDLLIRSDVLIGNSSCGMIEAGAAGTAVVNVGDRQLGRERHGRCVFDAAESAKSIQESLSRALRARPIIGARSCYGDGRAGERIAKLLGQLPTDERFRHKHHCG